MKNSKCKRSWFYLGIMSGFLTGFLYFAYGVYTHGSRRGVGPYDRTKVMPGTTIHRGYE